MRALLALTLIALVPASALAAPGVEGCHADLVCASESSAGSDCSEFGGGATSVVVAGQLVVSGSSYCYPGGGAQDVTIATAAASVYWGEFHYSDPENGEFRSCFVFVGPRYQALPCELGPPNPGWGDVLP